MSTISIEGTPVTLNASNPAEAWPVTLSGHLLLVFKDDIGREFVIRGGPGPSGSLVLEVDEPIETSTDARISQVDGSSITAEQRGNTTINFGDRDSGAVWEILKRHALNIDDAGFTYDPFGKNSNGTIGNLLALVGIDVNDFLPDPEGFQLLPFSGKNLDFAFDYSIAGTDKGDLLVGRAGSQSFAAGIGNDTLYGGIGNDSIYGQGGHDLIYADANFFESTNLQPVSDFLAPDFIDGGSGNDTLYSSIGLDTIKGGQGDDVIYADTDVSELPTLQFSGPQSVSDFLEPDLVDGGDGNDVIEALYGNDTLLGGEGDDEIAFYKGSGNFELGNVSIEGGTGNDTIYSEGANDTISGGAGNDVLTGGLGADVIDGGDGIDVLDFSGAASSGSEDGITYGVDLSLTSGFGGEADGDVYSDVEAVLGSAYSDYFDIGSDGGIFAGGDSTDVFDIYGSSSGDGPAIIWGGAGADYIYIDSDASDPAGILVANVNNLTEENFHLFDYQSLSGVDWSLIDVVILNPDSSDGIATNGGFLGTGRSTRFTSATLAQTGETVEFGHKVLQTSASAALSEQINPGQQFLADIVKTYSVGFWPGSVYAAATSVGYTVVSDHPDRRAEDERDDEVYGPPYTYDASSADDTVTLYYTSGGENEEECPEGFCGEPTEMARDYYAWLNYYYYENGQRQSAVTTDADGGRTFLSPGDIPDPSDVDDVGEWFLVGGTFNGTSISPSGSYSTSIQNPDGSEGAGSGSNQTNYNGSTGGGGTSTTYSGFTPASAVFVMGEAPVNPNAPEAGTTISQDGANVLISSSDGDVVLQDVDLSVWQAAAQAQVLGSSSTESVQASNADDLISSGAGDDTIYAQAGDDTIAYVSGDDVIESGNTGTDTLDLSQYYAGQVSFRVSGHDIFIDTPNGSIELDYQARHALGHSSSNIETIILADETLDDAGIRARALADQSTFGDDSIAGTYQDDTIFDDIGDDVIDAWYGDDTITYLAGDDVIERGNYGADTLDLSKYSSDQVSFRTDVYDILIDTPDGTIELDYQVRFNLGHAQSNIETLIFSDVTLDEAGIRARALADQSTSGDDSVIGSYQDDAIIGSAGNDTISAFAGDDTITYVSGDDVIERNNTGTDTLDLSLYTSTQVSFRNSGHDVLIDTPDGTIELDYQVRHELGHADSNIETLIFSDQTLDEEGIRARAMADPSTAGDDLIVGTYQDDVFVDAAGNDTIDAWYGDDVIDYVSGNDVIERGNYGADTLDLSQYVSDQVTFSVNGYDVFVDTPDGTIELDYQTRFDLGHSQSNIETLGFSDITLDEAGIRQRAVNDQNTAGDDFVSGSGFDDLIAGGVGNDTLNGNEGADTFSFVPGDGSDMIEDFVDGVDLIQFTGGPTGFGDLTIADLNGDAVVDYGSGDSITVSNLASSLLTQDDFVFV